MLEGVVLAGGRGERFWPLSRRARPKQFLPLFGGRSLIAHTWERLRRELAAEGIRVIAGSDLRERVCAELPEMVAERFVPEPVGRNTAPAVAVAAALGLREGDPLQLVVPADHWIPDAEAFWRSARAAAATAAATDGPLVTLGIPIRRPETGFGYIERGEERPEAAGVYRALCFHEKPERERAETYQRAGRFYWNSGIFVWRASALLAELEAHMPELHRLVMTLPGAARPQDLLAGIFERAAGESIDRGLLEKSRRVAVVEAGFAWSDLGSWSSWAELAEADALGTVALGETLQLDCENTLVLSDEGLVAALGVKDLVVVRTGDVTLVVDRERCQDVRRLLAELRERLGAERFL